MTTSLSISKNSHDTKRRKKDNSISFSNSELPPVPSFLLSSSTYANISYYNNSFSDEEDVIIIESDDDLQLEEVFTVELQDESIQYIPLSSTPKDTPNTNENLTSSQLNNVNQIKGESSPSSSSFSPKSSPVRKDKIDHILGKRKEISLVEKHSQEKLISVLQKVEQAKENSVVDKELEKIDEKVPQVEISNEVSQQKAEKDEKFENEEKIEQNFVEVRNLESSVEKIKPPAWLKRPLTFPLLNVDEKRNLMATVSEFPSFPIIEIPTRKTHERMANNSRNNINNSNNGRRYGNYNNNGKNQPSLSYYKLNSAVLFHDFPQAACDLLEFELNHFFNWISPTPVEAENRMNTISDISSVVKDLFPSVEVAVYGSVATSLCLPTSDIDMVIMCGGNCSLNLLFSEIKVALVDRGICEEDDIKIIYTAMVPIIKLVHKCGIPVDISFGNKSFLNNLSVVKTYLQKYEYAKSIILFLKQLLHQQNLNITYAGGLGSYSLVVIVLHFIQVNESITNIGELLLRFLQCYGYSFDYSKFGISCYHQGSYFLKEEKGWFVPWSPLLLSIEDPLDEENDLGRKAFNIQEVRILFADVYKKIIHTLIGGGDSDTPSGSLLRSIINEFTRF